MPDRAPNDPAHTFFSPPEHAPGRGTPDPARAAVPPRPRFSWPMRIFLSFIIFNMVFQSAADLVPVGQWRKDLDIDSYPLRLPTAKEISELAKEADEDNPNPVAERVMRSLDDVWLFWRPWPSPETRKKMHGWGDRGKFAFYWVHTRLTFLNNLVRFNQGWSMFSPSVAEEREVVRAVLVYADGTNRPVLSVADPADLTRYATPRFLTEKLILYSLEPGVGPRGDTEGTKGYCNLLAHRHPVSAGGAPLERIYLVNILFKFPPPGEDARAFWEAQNGPPGWIVIDLTPAHLALRTMAAQAAVSAGVPLAAVAQHLSAAGSAKSDALFFPGFVEAGEFTLKRPFWVYDPHTRQARRLEEE